MKPANRVAGATPRGAAGRPPLPGTGEEAADAVLFRRIPSGTVLWRMHRADKDALFYGDHAVDFRFNDPGPGATHPHAPGVYDASLPDAGAYGVCYFGFSPEAAFVETFLRRPARRDLALSEIDSRRLTLVRTSRELRLIQLDGPGLNRARVDGSVVSGADYALSRTVSRLVWRRGDAPDGLLYTARHDNHLYVVAMFDRAQPFLRAEAPQPIGDDLLSDLIRRYRFTLL